MERIRLKINLEAIAHNAQALKKIIHPAKIIAVLKADAYGLGLERISQCLWDNDVQRFAITTVQEAQTLRQHCPKAIIYHIGACFDQEIETLVDHDVILSAENLSMVEKIAIIAKKKQKKVAFQLLFDTGMGRLGIPFEQSEREWKKIADFMQKEKENITLKAVYSHFANANQKKDAYTHAQIKKFVILKTMIEQTLKQPTVAFHLSNSSGLMHYANAHFDFARVGIALYGGGSNAGDANAGGCESADASSNTSFGDGGVTKIGYELSSRIISVRELAKGSSIGYQCRYTLPQQSIVATIAAGYCDGIPMPLSGEYVLVQGEKVLVVGKISMDYTTVLIPRHLKVQVGDKVVFLGQQGDKKITIEDWAKIKNTNPHEILTSLGKRVKREYFWQNERQKNSKHC